VIGNRYSFNKERLQMKATVGRIVHFYNKMLDSNANNGIGHGPYAAIVTQDFGSGPYVNLKVLPYGNAWDEGSVSEKTEGATRYWEWPPRQ
jgi:hypothetical protein